MDLVDYINNFVNDLIEKRREFLSTQKVQNTNMNEKPVLIDILLQSEMNGKPLNNQDIRGEVNTFMYDCIVSST